MIAAVNPSSNGRGGSTYAPAGRPTGVTGAFSSPGTAAGTPPGVPTSSIIEGRNNRGSNVQVPYARLVPMHARENRHARDPTDKRLVTVNGRPQLEYDGLHQGELAWILGRRFRAVDGGGPGDDGANPPNGLEELGETQRYAHQAYAGLGNGVDRMQRLASTGWVQAMIQQKMQGASINLHAIGLSTDYAKIMDSGLVQYADYLAGASPLQTPDVTWWRAQIEGKNDTYAAVGFDPADHENSGRRLQGIYVAVTGPFLRGIQTDSKIVRFDEKRVKSDSVKATIPEDMPRNLGDSLAFSALETELRRRNLMDWTPDGIVLSKLESPTDEPMKSTELDARQAQLFNVGIQGPAITTSWTSDVRDHKLEVQPMDKVFICLVATLSYRVSTDGNNEYTALRGAQNSVLISMMALKAAIVAGRDGLAERKQLDDDITAAKTASRAYIGAVSAPALAPEYQVRKTAAAIAKKALDTAKKNNVGVAAAQVFYDAAEQAVNDLWKPATQAEVAAIKALGIRVRQNTRPATQAILTDFRLIRTTSSHMSNFSHYRPGDKNSRLGLRLGALQGAKQNNRSGLAEVIVGGWCIGTVIDSAATRSTIGFQTVKSHPTSMAINLNVNVQWWSGDKLYKHYMDTGGQVMMRSLKRPKVVVAGFETDEPLPEEDVDIEPPAVAPGAVPQVAGTADGDAIDDNDVPPMGEWRNVRQRTSINARAAASASTQPSAFAAAGGSRARQGSSRRA